MAKWIEIKAAVEKYEIDANHLNQLVADGEIIGKVETVNGEMRFFIEETLKLYRVGKVAQKDFKKVAKRIGEGVFVATAGGLSTLGIQNVAQSIRGDEDPFIAARKTARDFLSDVIEQENFNKRIGVFFSKYREKLLYGCPEGHFPYAELVNSTGGNLQDEITLGTSKKYSNEYNIGFLSRHFTVRIDPNFLADLYKYERSAGAFEDLIVILTETDLPQHFDSADLMLEFPTFRESELFVYAVVSAMIVDATELVPGNWTIG